MWKHKKQLDTIEFTFGGKFSKVPLSGWGLRPNSASCSFMTRSVLSCAHRLALSITWKFELKSLSQKEQKSNVMGLQDQNQWLRIGMRIKFKLCIRVNKCLNNWVWCYHLEITRSLSHDAERSSNSAHVFVIVIKPKLAILKLNSSFHVSEIVFLSLSNKTETSVWQHSVGLLVL